MKKFKLKIQYQSGMYMYQIIESKTNNIVVFGSYSTKNFKSSKEFKNYIISKNSKYFN